MKLLRYGPIGHERPGLLDGEGRIRDLSGHVADITPEVLCPESLARLRRIDLGGLPLVPDTVRIGPPLSRVGKFLAIGLNYRKHAIESGMPIPEQPVLFPKWTSCISGPDDDVTIPYAGCQLDWEVELCIVIGSRAQRVSVADAPRHIAGYCLSNDVSDRNYQFNGGAGQWGKGKGFDGFGPIGPCLVTSDEVGDPQALDLWLKVNDELVQNASTSDMIFGCAEIVSHCSRFMTLEPGDLIITGTPSGVGMGMKPPRYLQAGDVVTLGISGLGSQRQRIKAPPAQPD
ncbi:fumarylacetoacetate hydrolase family protein [Ramlibacter tataouinensis]|uniref:fumarylacetoacetate hydrolase family protein n=1 Tax=Ramlibacter tataouinensis TaxID=94132 RepID=UPI0022F3C24D|nr:fumarylacetoacetate hydrolase family protein [Ramlibacter tataouinensis]WBY03975.1 fumarylacetoacetate hydrolase family protein [Ramlibacter tataouinensis]